MKTALFAIVILTLSLLSCATGREAPGDWTGRRSSELTAWWGPPTYVIMDESGGAVLVYEQYLQTTQKPGKIEMVDPAINGSLPKAPRYEVDLPQPHGYIKTKKFYVNPKGVVYKESW